MSKPLTTFFNLCYGLYRARNGFNNRFYGIKRISTVTAPFMQNLLLAILGFKLYKLDLNYNAFSIYAISKDDLVPYTEVQIRKIDTDVYIAVKKH